MNSKQWLTGQAINPFSFPTLVLSTPIQISNDLVQWQQHCCRCHRTNACTKVIISERLAISGWSISSSQQLISPRAAASLDREIWSWSSTSSPASACPGRKAAKQTNALLFPLFPSTRYSIVSSLPPLFIHFLHTLSTVNNIELEQLKQLNCCLDCPNAFPFIPFPFVACRGTQKILFRFKKCTNVKKLSLFIYLFCLFLLLHFICGKTRSFVHLLLLILISHLCEWINRFPMHFELFPSIKTVSKLS